MWPLTSSRETDTGMSNAEDFDRRRDGARGTHTSGTPSLPGNLGKQTMTSSVKVGISVLVMLTAVVGFAGSSAAAVVCGPTNPCSIQIDDLTETPTVKVLAVNPANPSGPPIDVTSNFSPTTIGETINLTIPN